jgi:hypothetical protein
MTKPKCFQNKALRVSLFIMMLINGFNSCSQSICDKYNFIDVMTLKTNKLNLDKKSIKYFNILKLNNTNFLTIAIPMIFLKKVNNKCYLFNPKSIHSDQFIVMNKDSSFHGILNCQNKISNVSLSTYTPILNFSKFIRIINQFKPDYLFTVYGLDNTTECYIDFTIKNKNKVFFCIKNRDVFAIIGTLNYDNDNSFTHSNVSWSIVPAEDFLSSINKNLFNRFDFSKRNIYF